MLRSVGFRTRIWNNGLRSLVTGGRVRTRPEAAQDPAMHTVEPTDPASGVPRPYAELETEALELAGPELAIPPAAPDDTPSPPDQETQTTWPEAKWETEPLGDLDWLSVQEEPSAPDEFPLSVEPDDIDEVLGSDESIAPDALAETSPDVTQALPETAADFFTEMASPDVSAASGEPARYVPLPPRPAPPSARQPSSHRPAANGAQTGNAASTGERRRPPRTEPQTPYAPPRPSSRRRPAVPASLRVLLRVVIAAWIGLGGLILFGHAERRGAQVVATASPPAADATLPIPDPLIPF